MALRVQTLGGFGVAVDGRGIAPQAWPSRRSAQLVALVALSPGCRLPSDQAMEALWPELDADAARANLHKAATHARQAIGYRSALVLRAGMVQLDPEGAVSVDAHELTSAAPTALASGDAEACAALAEQYPGDLLPEFLYDEWTQGHRDRLHQLHCRLLRCAGRWAELAEQDPLDEQAHRELMAEHYRAGRLHAAIRQFQRLRTTLARELRVAPSRETIALYRTILGSSPTGWVRPALVGREVELVRARAALRRTAEGRPAALLVTGPAGIGKSRFCEEIVEQAAADGWFVLRAAATEASRPVPYGPLIDALVAAVQGTDIADQLEPPDRELLLRLAEPSADPPAMQRQTILRLVGRVLRAGRATRPLLFLDDLHLADEATWSVAAILASAPPPRGLLLIGACRDDHRLPPPLHDVWQSLVASGAGVPIALAALSRQETDLIVGNVAGRRVSASETDTAWQLSEGNPFFALEVAASLASDVGAPSAGAGGVLTSRLGRLSPDTQRALRATAMVADEFDADVVTAVSGLAPTAALDVLHEATAAGVVVTHAGGYRFRHDLVRTTLTADADETERRAAHAAFASWLADTGASAGRVADHLMAAGQRDEALPYLRVAAGHALAVGAHGDAVALADAALSIVPGDPDLLALRADALFRAGDPGARAAYGVAIAASRGTARSALVVRRARALVLSGDIAAAVESLDSLGSTPATKSVQYLVTRGLAVWCTGALDEAARLADEARQLAESSTDVRDFVDATMLQAMVAHERGAWPQQAALDLLDAQIRPDLASLVIDAHLCVAESYLYGGVRYADVITFATDLRARAAQAGIGHAEAFAMTLLGEAHLLTGEVDLAMDVLTSAVARYRRVGVLCGEALSLQRLAEAQLAAGSPDVAQATLAEALVAARGSPVATRHLLDRIHGTAIRAAPDQRSALAAVDEAARAVQGPLESCPPCSVNRTVPSAMACADAGDLGRAREFLALAEGAVAAFFRQGGWHAALDEARGHLARAEGDAELADRWLRQALDGFEREGQLLDARRCHEQLVAGKV